MDFNAWIAKWTNKPVDFDGIYPNQCMDLMHQYVYEFLGLTNKSLLAHPAAYQVFTEFTESQYFRKVQNTPDNVPPQGAILVFGQGVGPYGHVSIVVNADKKNVTSFDANWPTGSLPHKQLHPNYEGVLGWLEPIQTQASGTITIPIKERDSLISRATVAKEVATYLAISDPDHAPTESYIKVIAGIKSALTTSQTQNEQLKKELAVSQQETQNREEQVSRLKKQVTDTENYYTAQIDSLNKTAKNTPELLKEAEGRIKVLQDQLTEASKAKGEALNELAACKSGQTQISLLQQILNIVKRKK